MPAGVTVFNDDGNIQLDETYRNMFLRTKGTSTTCQYANAFAPLIAVRSTVYEGGTGDPWFAGALPRHPGDGSTASFLIPSNTSWWAFDTLTGTAATYGLEVFNESGQRTFSAVGHPLRFVSEFDGGELVSNWLGQTVTLPSGKTYAVIVASHALWYKVTSTPIGGGGGYSNAYDCRMSGAHVNNNVISFGWSKYYNQTVTEAQARDFDDVFGYTKFWIVDVSNY